MNYVDITPAMNADACTINGRNYKITTDGLYAVSGGITYSRFNAIAGKGNSIAWLSGFNAKGDVCDPFPHWWKLDMGGTSILSGIGFTPADDYIDCTVKDYKIEVSNDDITYETVLATTNTVKNVSRNTTTSVLINKTFTTPKMCRYIKITILSGYNTRPVYQWAGFYNLKLYGIATTNVKTFLDKFMNLYGYK